MTPQEQDGEMLSFSSVVYFHSITWPPRASTVFGLDGILPLGETPELLCGLENTIRASIDIAVSSKWVKSWLNYPNFNILSFTSFSKYT